jgi:uncharacterized protein (TIGR03435 family)
MTSQSLSKCPQCGSPLPEHAPAGLCPHCLMALNLQAQTVFTDDAAAAAPPLPPEQIAPHFPHLEILECLGRGGMGVVYKARQKTLNRLVALKLLAPERVCDANFAERFTREAQALAALNHPNIVTIYDFGQAGGFYFLLMEFVDGANLRQLLRTRKFTPEEALAIVPPLCDALQFAHERGIVHRDIKPENLLLGKDGRLKVADFGVAKMLGAPQREGTGGEPSTLAQATQAAGGTPGYSAPEQVSDPQHADSRADIYSLGAVFYELLTGELPGKRIEPPSRKVQIDVRLDAVVLRALENTPELRWQTAADLRTQVETIVADGRAEIAPPGLSNAVAAAELKRWKVTLWSVALAASSLSMPVLVFKVWGTSLSALAIVLWWGARNDPRKLALAKRLVLINGIGVASAAIWVACNTPTLPMGWLVPIVAGCLVGIGYCLSCWKTGKNDPASRGAARWSAKTAGAAAAAVFLAVGVAAWTIEHYRSRPFDEPEWAQDFLTLAKVPLIGLRPNRSGQNGITSSSAKIVAKGVSLRALLSYAYGTPGSGFRWSGNRVLLPAGVVDGKFDFVLSTPDQEKKALQAEIQKQLGLVAHRELREVDALVLTVPNINALELPATNGDNSSDSRGPGRFTFANLPMGDLTDGLEDALGEPVIDETELTQKYSGTLKWNLSSTAAAELPEIQRALSAQFGLVLTPSREPVEMLVAEKAP